MAIERRGEEHGKEGTALSSRCPSTFPRRQRSIRAANNIQSADSAGARARTSRERATGRASLSLSLVRSRVPFARVLTLASSSSLSSPLVPSPSPLMWCTVEYRYRILSDPSDSNWTSLRQPRGHGCLCFLEPRAFPVSRRDRPSR